MLDGFGAMFDKDSCGPVSGETTENGGLGGEMWTGGLCKQEDWLVSREGDGGKMDAEFGGTAWMWAML